MTLERRTPLRRKTGLVARQPLTATQGLARTGKLRARSPRRSGRYRQIAAACAEAIERDGHRCQAVGLIPGHRCWGPLDPQHVIPKGLAPELAAEPRNIVAICRGAHTWVGEHKAEARRLGLHGHHGDDLADLAERRHLTPDAKAP